MAYADRVWLAQYRAGTPHDIPVDGEGGFASALAMFEATVDRTPRQRRSSTTPAPRSPSPTSTG